MRIHEEEEEVDEEVKQVAAFAMAEMKKLKPLPFSLSQFWANGLDLDSAINVQVGSGHNPELEGT